MADSEAPTWGIFSRLVVAIGAAMIIAVAAKPYEKRIRPFFNELKRVQFETPHVEGVKPESSAKSTVPVSEPKSSELKKPDQKKQRDHITEGDRSELQSVLKKL